jgi:hypothetical protein
MKYLKVTSISEYGESTLSHSVGNSIPEEMYVLAILKGVINAGVSIKSFELVEA